MKKMLIFLILVATCFIGLQAYAEISNRNVNGKETVYQKENLHPETIKLLRNKDYQTITLPKELDGVLQQEPYTVVYFFSSTCSFCKKATPEIVKAAKELQIKIHFYNLLEFEQGWDRFSIEKTPTLVIFEKEKEIKRLEGLTNQEGYFNFLKKVRRHEQ
jgi:thioredoxin 1